MIFPYSAIISDIDQSGDYTLIRRPEIPINVVGKTGTMTYFGLVDTGFDHTILPKSIADDLGIALHAESGPPASTFGGQLIRLMDGEAVFKLESNGESVIWKTPICFFEFTDPSEETIVLGHSGFLDYFTATFDGKLGLLTLEPNEDLPIVTDQTSVP